jgi:hypothetical protein
MIESLTKDTFYRLTNIETLCEVEFLGGFLYKVLGFFKWLPCRPFADCQIANLEAKIFNY